ncbi:MAG: ABC transporter permease [Bacteroidales bacterium]|nr:ABC transporter permease [Bacteroidales bacterium]
MKFVLRNLYLGGVYTLINLLGMAVSLTAAIFIMLWIEDERNYDGFHNRSQDIYQTVVTFSMDGKAFHWKSSSTLMGVYAKNEVPEIEAVCRLGTGNTAFKRNEAETGGLRIGMVDPEFFSIFNFPLLEGNSLDPFPDNRSVVLSQKTAQILFGTEPAIGQIVYGDQQRAFRVTGVMKEMPENTMFRTNVDALFSFEMMYEGRQREEIDYWGRISILCFLLLQPNADAGEVAQKLTNIQRANMDDFEMTYQLQSIKENRFYNADGTESTYLQSCRLFTIAVVVLLLIACINYVNLVTARLSKRNREIFVKKAMGAKKSLLFIQSIGESGVLFLFSLILASGLLAALFPFFRELSGKNLPFNLFSISTLTIFGATFLFILIFSGTLPAINIAFQNPLQSTRNTFTVKKRNIILRRILVVLQFVAATVLILGAITMNRQLAYIQEIDLGYQREHVITFRMNESLYGRYDAIRADLLQHASIKGVTAASQNIVNVGRVAGWEGKDGQMLILSVLNIDADFIPTMGIELLAGNNFSRTAADASYFILNETTVREAGIEGDPIGQSFNFLEIDGTIIGVVRDFIFKDLRNEMGPLVLMGSPLPSVVYVRTYPDASAEAVAEIERVWKNRCPETILDYAFMEAQFERLYRSDFRSKDLFFCFALIAILVSCLGLFGLVTFTAEAKTKEIGIRKVMGAGIGSVVAMISKEFLILIGIAILIAFPLAYYWLIRLLQGFAYRVPLSIWIFIWAAIITVLLTMLTLAWKAFKAAMANPVKSIKSE